jgi:uncharacterized protein (TIGR02145 family)
MKPGKRDYLCDVFRIRIPDEKKIQSSVFSSPRDQMNRNETLKQTDMKIRTIMLVFPMIIVGMVVMMSTGCKKKETTPDPVPAPIPQTVTDFDGNVYQTVKIGTQVWLMQDLKVTHYNNGDPIPINPTPWNWKNLKTGAYVDYSNTPSLSAIYGRLYNWYAATDHRLIAPPGWHVPSEAEWATLITYLGGDQVAGGELKEAGSTHWWSNTAATNGSGFTGLPGGNCSSDGFYYNLNYYGFEWSTTADVPNKAWCIELDGSSAVVKNYVDDKIYGFAVRCIMD